ncbi:MAG: adenylate/guanylate cyclase domain-containing protein, partial [bacterium]|nr:adenylate/guanylate cyclase domain-containing protein [bacterium]
DSKDEQSPVHILHWDRRATNTREFRPSRRLIRKVLSTGDSVIQIWSAEHPANAEFTASDDADWSFCTPITGKASRDWALYVSGTSINHETHDVDHDKLRDDLKFTELVASTVGSLREVKMLQRRSAGLSQFFSPVVTETLAGKDPDEVLAPRETDVAVLFCDLRGFTRRSEEQLDKLLELLERVSRALGVMTHCILEEGGVVGDFHGDAAMGFWGWPIEQENSVASACRAALNIRRAFADAATREDHPLRDFRMGVGLAYGRAVAGKIGTVDQVKVTVFGPVVNLASRLESMTKKFRAPILLDAAAAEIARQTLPKDVGRLRTVAVVRPYGMKGAVEVSELLPPESVAPEMRDDHIAAYEKALSALIDGDWSSAFSLLHHVPAEDRVKDFLTVLIAQHNRTAPDGWDGVVHLDEK